MREADFLKRWHAERDSYVAWGKFVKNLIERDLAEKVSPISLNEFVKIAFNPRPKDDDSLLGKAFHRKKPYKDPYLEIEDKVGIRFVVLLTQDIYKIQQVIEAAQVWTWSLDKDFEAEREAKPLEFVYQSKHYVVKAAEDIDIDGVKVAKGTPCEIQLRTLLQHAHSELTHDNIYKREPGAPPNRRVERTVAKSMALIEAVDDYFLQAVRELEEATVFERGTLKELAAMYRELVKVEPHIDKTNMIVVNAYRDSLTAGDLQARLKKMAEKFPFLGGLIASRVATQYAFRQPWILLAYLMVTEAPNEAAGRWPLTADELRPVFTDLGKAYPAA